MNSLLSQFHQPQEQFARLGRAAMLAALGFTAGAAAAASTNVHFKAEVTLKETYDSNVYLQDNAPNPLGVAAARAAGFKPVEANKASWVTSVLPKVGVEFKPDAAFGLSAAYAPDITFYHGASSEDYVAHRGTLNLGGKVQDTLWELANTATYIDGSTEGPTFARPDDVPALGGIPLRDRRAAFVFRNSFRLTQPVGKWFLRPVASSYIHDFKTDQHYVAPATRASLYSYENYIDRQEINGGLDVGYQVAKGTFLVTGYRYGRQDQFQAPSGPGGAVVNSSYGNTYHRILVGVEGSPTPWLKLAVLAGPDLRTFDAGTPAGFERNEFLYFVDALVTVLPTKNDAMTFKATRYEQPAFSSFSVYEDIKYDLSWRHKFNEHLTVGAGFTLYVGDWQAPANREDWIYTPNVSMLWTITAHLGAELAYSYDWVDNKVRPTPTVEPYAASHEFTRHLASLAVKYTF